jgi:hypothetical protein
MFSSSGRKMDEIHSVLPAKLNLKIILPKEPKKAGFHHLHPFYNL